jgi:hypothetical protein
MTTSLQIILFFTNEEYSIAKYIYLDYGSKDEVCVVLWRSVNELRNRVIVRPASLALREQNAYYRRSKASVATVCLHCLDV